jgi:hypothetical protein
MAEDALRALRNVDGLIANALEIVIDSRDGQDQAEIRGHELVQREELDDAIVDFDLEFIDGVFFFQDALGQLFIRFQNGVNRLVHRPLRQAPHPKQALLQFVQVLFEVPFHEAFPFTILLRQENEERFLASLGMTGSAKLIRSVR